MAKFYREDIVVWKPPGGGNYYLLERAALEQDKVKKCVHRFGKTADAVFPYRHLAEVERLKFPSQADAGKAAD